MDYANGQADGILDHNGRPWRAGREPSRERARGDRMALPAHLTSAAIVGGGYDAYWHDRFDEAMRNGRRGAVEMRNDLWLMGLLRERKDAVLTANWDIKAENDGDPLQVKAAGVLHKALETRTPGFYDLRASLMEAVWYGRSAVQIRWCYQEIDGCRVLCPAQWTPVNGDKIGHHFDGCPYVLVYGGTSGQDLPGARFSYSTLGKALDLRGTWRTRFVLHHHELDDVDYFDAEASEARFGVGVRSRVFWIDWMKKSFLEWAAVYMQRMGLGLTLWYYQAGDPAALAAAQTAAANADRQCVLFVPAYGDSKTVNGGKLVERVETPISSVETLKAFIEGYFDKQIERYIIGQEGSASATSGSGHSNLGSTRFMEQTKGSIIIADAKRLDESLTGHDLEPGLLSLMQRWSDFGTGQGATHPSRKGGFRLRFKHSVERTESAEKLDAAVKLIQVGVELKKDEVREAGGFSKPLPDDDVLGGQQPGMGMGGTPGGGGMVPGQEEQPGVGRTQDWQPAPTKTGGTKWVNPSNPADVRYGDHPPSSLKPHEQNVPQEQVHPRYLGKGGLPTGSFLQAMQAARDENPELYAWHWIESEDWTQVGVSRKGTPIWSNGTYRRYQQDKPKARAQGKGSASGQGKAPAATPAPRQAAPQPQQPQQQTPKADRALPKRPEGFVGPTLPDTYRASVEQMRDHLASLNTEDVTEQTVKEVTRHLMQMTVRELNELKAAAFPSGKWKKTDLANLLAQQALGGGAADAKPVPMPAAAQATAPPTEAPPPPVAPPEPTQAPTPPAAQPAAPPEPEPPAAPAAQAPETPPAPEAPAPEPSQEPPPAAAAKAPKSKQEVEDFANKHFEKIQSIAHAAARRGTGDAAVDGDDVASEVALRLSEEFRKGNIDPGDPEIPGLIKTTAKNVVTDLLRKAEVRNRRAGKPYSLSQGAGEGGEDAPQVADKGAHTPLEHAEAAERSRRVHEALSASNLTPDEIANALQFAAQGRGRRVGGETMSPAQRTAKTRLMERVTRALKAAGLKPGEEDSTDDAATGPAGARAPVAGGRGTAARGGGQAGEGVGGRQGAPGLGRGRGRPAPADAARPGPVPPPAPEEGPTPAPAGAPGAGAAQPGPAKPVKPAKPKPPKAASQADLAAQAERERKEAADRGDFDLGADDGAPATPPAAPARPAASPDDAIGAAAGSLPGLGDQRGLLGWSKSLFDKLNVVSDADTSVLDALERSGDLQKMGLGHNEVMRAVAKSAQRFEAGGQDGAAFLRDLDAQRQMIAGKLVPGLRRLAAEGRRVKGYAGPVDLAAAADWYEKHGLGVIDALKAHAQGGGV